jgi:hypothetical protein
MNALRIVVDTSVIVAGLRSQLGASAPRAEGCTER